VAIRKRAKDMLKANKESLSCEELQMPFFGIDGIGNRKDIYHYEIK